jgi:hypothetical protein
MLTEIIAVYTDNQTEQVNTLCGENLNSLIVKAGGTRTHLAVLNGKEVRALSG